MKGGRSGAGEVVDDEVSIIADDLGSNHEGGYEQAVSGGTTRNGELCLQFSN